MPDKQTARPYALVANNDLVDYVFDWCAENDMNAFPISIAGFRGEGKRVCSCFQHDSLSAVHAIMNEWNSDDPDGEVHRRDSFWFREFFNSVFAMCSRDLHKVPLSGPEAEGLACTWVNCRRVYEFITADASCARYKDSTLYQHHFNSRYR